MPSDDPKHSSLITHHSSLGTPSWLTPARLNFYLAGYLLTECLLFLFLQSTSGVLDRQDRVRGRDFLNFYVNGTIIARGEVEHLYDADYFLQVQEEIATVNKDRPRYYAVYPPTTAFLFSYLARLPYPAAILLWWLVLAACFLVSGCCLVGEIEPAPAWRTTTILALAAFTPIWSTFTNGQLAGVFLLVFYGALKLHQGNYRLWAGVLLSLLALKPQLAVGPCLWMLFRLDWKAMVGFCLGVLLQVGSVTANLGHEVFVDFVTKGTRNALEMARIDHISPDHQHSLGGVLTNLFGQEHTDLFNRVHLAVAAVAALLFFKIVWPGAMLSRPKAAFWHWQRYTKAAKACHTEYSALVIFSVFLTPHLLTYDLSLLLIPVAFLWSMGKVSLPHHALSPGGRGEGERADHFEEMKIGTGVYLSAIPTFLYYFTFSLVPAALLWALYRLAKCSPAARG